MRIRLFYQFNRLVARLRGSVGYCAMAYLYNRTYMGRNPLSAWWNAFMFEFRGAWGLHPLLNGGLIE